MKQVTQRLGSGQMQVLEIPVPTIGGGQVLVRNHYSVISAGTEGVSVTTARKSLVGKARERPQQVRQAIDVLKQQGPIQTYRAVMKKLEAHSPLGYSCVGEVIDVAPDVDVIKVGDLVACGGVTASHAEIVAVPKNLCVKIPQDADLKAAAYNTLGAIALQGIRQADVRIGETCAVIGLGLIGQLTGLILRAAGIRVLGIDIDPTMVDMANDRCLDLALIRDDAGAESKIAEFTNGIGCDAVIITAASKSLDPINFAGAISSKQGTIVVVGDVPTGFEREPHFYKKELTVKMSRSYGPGRYDPEYEEKGRDYPVGYVRWTEKRNMEAFQDLIYNKKIDVSYLTTHIFKLEDASAAYDMIINKSEPFLGILIEYDTTKPIDKKKVVVSRPSAVSYEPSAVSIGFIGAGSYAQAYLLPNIAKSPGVILKGVMTSSSTGSRSVADRFGFEFCSGQGDDILDNDEINTIFIATRHDSHAYYVKKALEAGKHVYVEKPLCLTVNELEEIVELCNSQLATRNSQPVLVVGYNRRFSPLSRILKEKLGKGPMSMIYRINAGPISADSWIQDTEIGGGRIIGEVCHFIDYLTFMNGSPPLSVYAAAMQDADGLNDTVNINLSFENGSVGSLSYFANGSRSLPKEYIEIYRTGVTGVVRDFKELEIHGNKRLGRKLLTQDKGQKHMIKAFINSVKNGRPCPISFEDIFTTSLVTFKVIESVKTGQAVTIE